jgi:hypothetical protein
MLSKKPDDPKAAEHRELYAMFNQISSRLDMLSSLNMTPMVVIGPDAAGSETGMSVISFHALFLLPF